MIRLRIHRFTDEELGKPANGLLWYEDGDIMGRVVIEQAPWIGVPPEGVELDWTPVEVIDES